MSSTTHPCLAEIAGVSRGTAPVVDVAAGGRSNGERLGDCFSRSSCVDPRQFFHASHASRVPELAGNHRHRGGGGLVLVADRPESACRPGLV
jgi:hypothetical protein